MPPTAAPLTHSKPFLTLTKVLFNGRDTLFRSSSTTDSTRIGPTSSDQVSGIVLLDVFLLILQSTDALLHVFEIAEGVGKAWVGGRARHDGTAGTAEAVLVGGLFEGGVDYGIEREEGVCVVEGGVGRAAVAVEGLDRKKRWD